MKKLLVILSLAACVSFALAQQRWEYATFTAEELSYLWSSPERVVGPNSNIDIFYQVLSERPLPDTLTPLGGVLNYAGEQGWELIGIDSGLSQRIYIFKRPVEGP